MWKTTASKIVYATPWLKLREDKVTVQSGEELTYTYVDHAGAVFMVPITKSGTIILIRSFRQTLGQWCWEIPAGSLADVSDLKAIELASKELIEEIGATSYDLISLGEYYFANGIARLKGEVFLARNVEYSGLLDLDVGEEISEVREFSISEVEDMIVSGELVDADSAFALFLAFRYIAQNNIK